MANLLHTYENNAAAIGRFEKKRNGREYALVPISHTTQSAHIEVHLSFDGDFLRAKVVDKDDANTIIPCTEKSASRTSAPEPYPLFDKLMYVAGDYPNYCPRPKGTPHDDYMKNLQAWCKSPEAHPKVQSVYAYLRKRTLITDLIREKILWVDKNGQLIEKWTNETEEKPLIFKVLAGTQESAFVRFAVDVPGHAESRLWRDSEVQESFIRYYERMLASEDLCYVTGEVRPYADKHASRLRNAADKAKLISANDTRGFTFRGRFQDSRDVAAVSYDASQKAHNALKWLIERQGSLTIDGKVFLVWGTERLDLPHPFWDSFDLHTQRDAETGLYGDETHQEFAGQIRRALDGYRYESGYQSRVIVMALDAATPGRLSIVYYRELERDPFLERLQHWHESCCWLHRYHKNNNQFISFWGAPATQDIAFAAYGQRVSDQILKKLLERMLPCIVDGQPIPRDVVRSAIHRASSPAGMETWAWEKTLSVTCALVNKTYENEGGFGLAVNEQLDSRDYLFGRLLAIADVLERSTLEEGRATNAIRYMNAFARYPARTWGIIQSNIQPYQAKLGTRATYFNQLIDKVGARLNPEDFTDQPLGGLYLLGFYSQRYDLYTKRSKKTDGPEAENDLNQQEENEHGNFGTQN